MTTLTLITMLMDGMLDAAATAAAGRGISWGRALGVDSPRQDGDGMPGTHARMDHKRKFISVQLRTPRACTENGNYKLCNVFGAPDLELRNACLISVRLTEERGRGDACMPAQQFPRHVRCVGNPHTTRPAGR